MHVHVYIFSIRDQFGINDRNLKHKKLKVLHDLYAIKIVTAIFEILDLTLYSKYKSENK